MITGLHHVTAIASDPQKNLNFYRDFLGLRLVKKTVNFDDPTTYHFYFGDQTGSPGTIITFFPWPGTFRGRRGPGQSTHTAYTVPQGSLGYWLDRARQHHVLVDGPQTRLAGEEFLTVTDPDGMLIELVATGEGSGHELAQFHSVRLTEHDPAKTAELLTGLMGFTKIAEDQGRIRLGSTEAGYVDLVGAPTTERRGSLGAGIVHHIAFRTPSDDAQKLWHQKIAAAGYGVSPIMDRNYFHSIYFREPGGVLFEIATDPPGFAVDEPVEALGQKLQLPAWYEPQRAELEAVLPKVS
jgi:glyoxalase family protein